MVVVSLTSQDLQLLYPWLESTGFLKQTVEVFGNKVRLMKH
jgi:hypothetical protein